MHELAITQDLVDLVAERTVGRQVLAVNVRVGRDSGIVADSMAFSYDVVTMETPLEGSRLVIEEVAGDELSLVSVELAKEPSCA
ncbi:MAG TPA: hydrogenase maturation nickel metallochaperone HypA [Nocardioidaceae bacterium]|nr:hydrogenase maturation nickel metallochaperone HypA [Nocardioidaceae bacterium]